jgi:hypothetical protein
LVEIGNVAWKSRTKHKSRKETKRMIEGRRKSSKGNKIGQLTIKNYTFERVEIFLKIFRCYN